MKTYGQIMLIVTPLFLLAALAEKWYGRRKGRDTVRTMDMISSISSGMTNITKDSLGLTVTLFSYAWMSTHLALVHIGMVPSYVVAVVAIDFQVYWMHRLSHRINYLWNTHAIHHSSEEFNLACGLRQSISTILNPFTPLLLPAALVGVPLRVILVVGPLHLFAQFWYHTRHIPRLGFLELFLVTPSHHRVHHAINPEYLDRNFSSLFIIWDRLFGTFQEERDDVPPVYGNLRPAATWNPVRINYQHAALLVRDAWRTRSLRDKLRIWFMPTGWRPADVRRAFPVGRVRDVLAQRKYDPSHHRLLPAWSWVQLAVTLGLLGYLFAAAGSIGIPMVYLYGAFVILSIFAYTELMDGRKLAVAWEAARCACALLLLCLTGSWFGLHAPLLLFGLVTYFGVSLVVVVLFVFRGAALQGTADAAAP